MTIHVPHEAVGYAAGPTIFAIFAANAPWVVTVITGILASAWYARQLYKDFKKKDDDKPQA